MARFLLLLWLWSILRPAAEANRLSLQRNYADRRFVNSVSKARTAYLSDKRGYSLYWLLNMTVGDASGLQLVIDTGSSDMVLNKGVYKPSKYAHSYKGNNSYSIAYEGVNRTGFGLEFINGTTAVDVASAGNLTVQDQVFAMATSWKFEDTPMVDKAYPGDGIVGFIGPRLSDFHPRAYSWIFNLAYHKQLKERRFGLACGTSGTGEMIIGEYDKNLADGPPVKVPLEEDYVIQGDVTLGGEILFENQTLSLDVGTDNLQGPIPSVKSIFEKLGWSTTLAKSKYLNILEASFECDNPPVFGLSLPTKSQLLPGEKAQIFNVSPDVWGFLPQNGTSNCTSILGGTGVFDFWLMGQSFFSGHYLDFNLETKTLSIANLKDAANAK